jgi:hypothetical protein
MGEIRFNSAKLGKPDINGFAPKVVPIFIGPYLDEKKCSDFNSRLKFCEGEIRPDEFLRKK